MTPTNNINEMTEIEIYRLLVILLISYNLNYWFRTYRFIVNDKIIDLKLKMTKNQKWRFYYSNSITIRRSVSNVCIFEI